MKCFSFKSYFTHTRNVCPMERRRSMDVLSGSLTRKLKDKLLINLNNNMRTFEELKQELLNRAKNAGACANGYRMGLESKIN